MYFQKSSQIFPEFDDVNNDINDTDTLTYSDTDTLTESDTDTLTESDTDSLTYSDTDSSTYSDTDTLTNLGIIVHNATIVYNIIAKQFSRTRSR